MLFSRSLPSLKLSWMNIPFEFPTRVFTAVRLLLLLRLPPPSPNQILSPKHCFKGWAVIVQKIPLIRWLFLCHPFRRFKDWLWMHSNPRKSCTSERLPICNKQRGWHPMRNCRRGNGRQWIVVRSDTQEQSFHPYPWKLPSPICLYQIQHKFSRIFEG
jgi:hypothetical protein